jgi:hypothetical protein
MHSLSAALSILAVCLWGPANAQAPVSLSPARLVVAAGHATPAVRLAECENAETPPAVPETIEGTEGSGQSTDSGICNPPPKPSGSCKKGSWSFLPDGTQHDGICGGKWICVSAL